jgi:hypothetical protein
MMAMLTQAMETRYSAMRKPGEELARHIDTSLRGCGCVTHQREGIDVAACGRSGTRTRPRYRCLTCGKAWAGKELER